MSLGLTSRLRMEHTTTRLVLDIVRTLCAPEAAPPPSSADLEKCVQYLIVNHDRCHTAKEEGVLYPELARLGSGSCAAALQEMRPDHAAVRELIRRMVWALDRWETDPCACCTDLAQLASLLAEELDRHFALEEAVLYAHADRDIVDGRTGTILAQFEQLEREHLGTCEGTALDVCAQWVAIEAASRAVDGRAAGV